MPENLKQLSVDYPDLRLIKLEQNYRSRGRILKLANHLIANNQRPFEKTLWSELGYGDPVRIFQCPNEVKEAERVVSELMSMRFQQRLAHRDLAIIYRSNYQARILEQKLMEMQIPYQLSGGQSFFDRTEIRDVMAYLKVLCNPKDDAALTRILNTPRRGIGAASIETLNRFALEMGISMREAMEQETLYQRLSKRGAGGVENFNRTLIDLEAAMENLSPAELIDETLRAIDYQGWLRDQSDSEELAERRWRNITELGEWMNRMAGDDESPDLVDIIRRLTLSDMLDRNNDEDDQDQVSLMTLHAAKGLEFDHVFIVGMEEDILPHANSQDAAGIEEERRLFYVGITRARKTLVLSMAGHRKRYGEVIICSPSRFLDELPADDLEWSRGGQVDEAESRQRGRAHLAGIREMLAKSRA